MLVLSEPLLNVERYDAADSCTQCSGGELFKNDISSDSIVPIKECVTPKIAIQNYLHNIPLIVIWTASQVQFSQQQTYNKELHSNFGNNDSNLGISMQRKPYSKFEIKKTIIGKRQIYCFCLLLIISRLR
jgi:hypothetical protein